jgi:hypothetical protein
LRLEEFYERLLAIRDPTQRAYALSEGLARLDDADLLRAIDDIRLGALAGAPGMRTLYLGLLFMDALNRGIGERRMSHLVEMARDSGNFAVVAILMDLPGEESASSMEGGHPDVGLNDVPLGVRKALARRPDPKFIRVMARDQDHRVIRNLLDNSRLTETDVTKIASARPASSRVLDVIFRHPKWITRYAVQRVIALNPATPLSLSLRLLALIRLVDLEEVRDSPELHPTLQEMAGRAVREKTALLWGYDRTY